MKHKISINKRMRPGFTESVELGGNITWCHLCLHFLVRRLFVWSFLFLSIHLIFLVISLLRSEDLFCRLKSHKIPWGHINLYQIQIHSSLQTCSLVIFFVSHLQYSFIEGFMSSELIWRAFFMPAIKIAILSFHGLHVKSVCWTLFSLSHV